MLTVVQFAAEDFSIDSVSDEQRQAFVDRIFPLILQLDNIDEEDIDDLDVLVCEWFSEASDVAIADLAALDQ